MFVCMCNRAYEFMRICVCELSVGVFMCMRVKRVYITCVYVCAYICVQASYMYIGVHARLQVCTWMMYVSVCAHVCTYVCVYLRKCVRCVCVCVCVYVCA